MRILLVTDVPGWAFDIDAGAMIKYLPEYDISKICKSKFSNSMIGEYDLVHFMNWYDGQSATQSVTAGVCSHNFELLHADLSNKLFPKYKALVTSSKMIYELTKDKNDNVFYAPKGVDENLFVPINLPRKKSFIVGWTGQETSGRIDIKGYNAILSPLMELLSSYPDIGFRLLKNTHKDAIPHNEMASYYREIDCQICTSFREGGPNPMFEAASCGKALISTRVGAISDFIKHGENGFIVDAYSLDNKNEIQTTIQSFLNYILTLKNDRDLCDDMGQKSRELIKGGWTWKQRAKDWLPVFEMFRR